MDVGEIKSSQLSAAGITILFFIVLGFWVAKSNPKKTVQDVQKQPVETFAPEKNIESFVSQVFTPLGESGVALKLPAGYVFDEQQAILEDLGHYRVFITSKNALDEYLVELVTLLGVKQNCQDNDCSGTPTEEQFLALQNSFQTNIFKDDENKHSFFHRDFVYSRKAAEREQGEPEYFRTFFGDNYLLQVFHTDEKVGGAEPSSELLAFMNSIQFSSKLASRYGIEQLFTKIFAEKNLVSIQAIKLDNLWITENHIKGEVQVTTTSGVEASTFFSVKDDGQWQFVFEGGSDYKCSVLAFYAFPSQMQAGCK